MNKLCKCFVLATFVMFNLFCPILPSVDSAQTPDPLSQFSGRYSRTITISTITTITQSFQRRTQSFASFSCSFGLGPNIYDGILLYLQIGSNPEYFDYFLQLTCKPNVRIPLSFREYTGPFTPYDHVGWRLIGVRGYSSTEGNRYVFVVTSISGWVKP